MKLSIVIPVYNEEGNIRPLHGRLKTVLTEMKCEYELIFVDDGSTDKSFDIQKSISNENENIILIRFCRNYGQTAAMHAGFQNSKGDIIVTLDADQQNNPEDIPLLVKALIDNNADAVSGWRYNRKDTISRKVMSSAANMIISKICGLKLHDYGCTLKAYKSKCIKDLKLYGEMHRFIPAFIFWNGGKVIELKVTHNPRIHGSSSYGMDRVYRVILDLITTKFLTTYAARPIHIFGLIGILSMIGGACIGGYVFVRKVYLGGQYMSPMFFASVFMIGLGVVLIFMGILAEIIVRIYFSHEEHLPYKIDENIQS